MGNTNRPRRRRSSSARGAAYRFATNTVEGEMDRMITSNVEGVVEAAAMAMTEEEASAFAG